MPKKASEYEEEICYTGKTWSKQHKNPECRYLKNREVIKTNRQEAWRKGAKQICVYCWWDDVAEEVKVSNIISFIAKPVQIEAINWTGENLEEIRQFCNNMAFMENGSLYIETLEGTMRARTGDWIVRGTRGEFYPVKPDVMEAKYEKLADKTKKIIDNLYIDSEGR